MEIINAFHSQLPQKEQIQDYSTLSKRDNPQMISPVCRACCLSRFRAAIFGSFGFFSWSVIGFHVVVFSVGRFVQLFGNSVAISFIRCFF